MPPTRPTSRAAANRALGLMLTSACSKTRSKFRKLGVSASISVFLSTSESACFKSRSVDDSLRPPRPTMASSRSAARELSASRRNTATRPTRPATTINATNATTKFERVIAALNLREIAQFPSIRSIDGMANLGSATDESAADIQNRQSAVAKTFIAIKQLAGIKACLRIAGISGLIGSFSRGNLGQ